MFSCSYLWLIDRTRPTVPGGGRVDGRTDVVNDASSGPAWPVHNLEDAAAQRGRAPCPPPTTTMAAANQQLMLARQPISNPQSKAARQAVAPFPQKLYESVPTATFLLFCAV
jgi:hypothetical protein